MSFKTYFYIVLGDGNKRHSVQLKKEDDLNIAPYEGMKIRMNFKKQQMKSVVYDMDIDAFTVELKTDDFISLGFSETTIEDLVNEYIKEGWERTMPLDPDERVKNLIIASAVSEIEYAIRDSEGNSSIRKISGIIAKSDLIGSVETERIFDMLRFPLPKRILILNDINRILSEKDIAPDTDEKISSLSFNELLEAIKEIEDHTTGNIFINKVARLIFESGIKQEMNIHQVFYFAKIPPVRGNVIMSRLKDLREIRE
ncbi:MAG: hypothetical protein KAS66_13155 [Candidatus Omnitrophica bacterium]|nr:hypothetical protein [Candidatus Omnitrophota bacterium]